MNGSREEGKDNVTVEDEKGRTNSSSRRSSNQSPDLSDEEESEDDRRTIGRSTRIPRTHNFDEQRPRRLRARDWDADYPPQAQNGIRWHGNPHAGPHRRSLQGLQYRPAAYTMNSPYTRTQPPRRTMYRSRSLTPPARRRSRSDTSRYKREKIIETIKPLAAGAAGFITGGFIGHVAGDGNMMATIAGAVIGAVGASEVENEWERHKERKKESKGRMRD